MVNNSEIDSIYCFLFEQKFFRSQEKLASFLLLSIFLPISVIIFGVFVIAGLNFVKNRFVRNIQYNSTKSKDPQTVAGNIDKTAEIPQKNKPFNKNDPATRAKHQKHIEACKKQELEDGNLENFAKSGTIFIPHAVDDAAFAKKCEAPDNIMLDKVFYDPSGNEVFDIGTDIDDIETNPSTVVTLDPDTLRTTASSPGAIIKANSKENSKNSH
ncbi:unnamed protein product [Caenorhabditis angaria]|uniref:Uncharacterized protein n=1 Tax=Caenorhabditis angaria TaxID=860376 RepID=A0A9P1IHN5_9PELO|nr:unnamed protein product [Caenorhabditis angaria]